MEIVYLLSEQYNGLLSYVVAAYEDLDEAMAEREVRQNRFKESKFDSTATCHIQPMPVKLKSKVI